MGAPLPGVIVTVPAGTSKSLTFTNPSAGAATVYSDAQGVNVVSQPAIVNAPTRFYLPGPGGWMVNGIAFSVEGSQVATVNIVDHMSDNVFWDSSGNLHLRPTPGSDANAIILQVSPGQIQFYGPTGQQLAYFNNAGNQAGLSGSQNAFYIGNLGHGELQLDVNGTPGLYSGFQDVQTAPSSGTLSGTTAGSMFWAMPRQGSAYKKFIATLSGYQNSTATAQTVSFVAAFTAANAVTQTPAGFTPTVSLTTLTLPASMASPVTGVLIVQGR